jgi:predicted nicotinamide N-methyase
VSDDATTIAGYRAALTQIPLSARAIAIYTVADLEAYVDRAALLRGDAEPPYWAHLWTGARVLAAYVERWVPVMGKTVLDLGCGLGLTGLVAARAGATVRFVDNAAPALDFVGASARVNGLAIDTCAADFRALPADDRFDLILAAEVAYDPPTFSDLAAALARHLAPAGTALVADGYRTDTRPLYRELQGRALLAHAIDVRASEDGRVAPVRITSLRLRGQRGRD